MEYAHYAASKKTSFPASEFSNHLGHLGPSERCETILILILGTPVSQREFIVLLAYKTRTWSLRSLYSNTQCLNLVNPN